MISKYVPYFNKDNLLDQKMHLWKKLRLRLRLRVRVRFRVLTCYKNICNFALQ
jgi:hypothetical protein